MIMELILELRKLGMLVMRLVMRLGMQMELLWELLIQTTLGILLLQLLI
jgi:hypothetical protein